MRILLFATLTFLVGCVDLSTICPHKPIMQGVFGEVVDANNALEQNVEVTISTILNGAKGTMFGDVHTSRGGYQFMALAGTYMVCAKTVCATVTVPTGLVELSAVDATAGLTWDAPVLVPPDQMIGPCKFGS
jgi:hypothetical protein